jgi:hypothetical protein
MNVSTSSWLHRQEDLLVERVDGGVADQHRWRGAAALGLDRLHPDLEPLLELRVGEGVDEGCRGVVRRLGTGEERLGDRRARGLVHGLHAPDAQAEVRVDEAVR